VSIKKAEYRGYKIKRSGIENIWYLDRPDNVKVMVRETDNQKFETEQDFYEYIDLLEDLKELKEEPIKKAKSSILKPKFMMPKATDDD